MRDADLDEEEEEDGDRYLLLIISIEPHFESAHPHCFGHFLTDNLDKIREEEVVSSSFRWIFFKTDQGMESV